MLNGDGVKQAASEPRLLRFWLCTRDECARLELTDGTETWQTVTFVGQRGYGSCVTVGDECPESDVSLLASGDAQDDARFMGWDKSFDDAMHACDVHYAATQAEAA